MIGWATSGLPKTLRPRVWCTASASEARMMPDEASAQSSRVRVTMSRMVRMPASGVPSRKPNVSENSTSEEALERLPILSFRRWKRRPLLEPSSSRRGTRKQPTPSRVWASMTNPSLIGADMNHLWPESR